MCAFEHGWMQSAKIDFAIQKKKRKRLSLCSYYTNTLWPTHTHCFFKAFGAQQKAEARRILTSPVSFPQIQLQCSMFRYIKHSPAPSVTSLWHKQHSAHFAHIYTAHSHKHVVYTSTNTTVNRHRSDTQTATHINWLHVFLFKKRNKWFVLLWPVLWAACSCRLPPPVTQLRMHQREDDSREAVGNMADVTVSVSSLQCSDTFTTGILVFLVFPSWPEASR